MIRRVLFIACFIGLCGCDTQKDSYIVLRNDVNCDVPRVYQLRITITNGGHADQKIVPEKAGVELGFPSSLVLDLPNSRTGIAQLVIEAIDDNLHLIGQGTASVQIDQGNSIDVPVQIQALSNATVITTPDAGTTKFDAGAGVGIDGGSTTKLDASTPGSGVAFLQVAAGMQNTCGVRVDGSLWCWGDNSHGQLHLSGAASRLSPTQVLGDGWQNIACGQTHCCGLRAGAQLSCWGNNNSAQLGSPITGDAQQTDLGAGWQSVTTGSYHSCAIKADSTLWCWGDNTNGQLGTGTTVAVKQPTQLPGEGWTQVSSTYLHTCAVKQDGTLWCWGNNANFQLGQTQFQMSPAKVAGNDWTYVVTGLYHTCGRHQNGSLSCWGGNISGQIGNPSIPVDRTGSTGKISDPAPVTGMWTAISAGQSHTCGVQPDKTLWCWGDNAQGQLGDNTLVSKSSPNQVVVPGQTWEQVAAGGGHTCALASDGTVWCWGQNVDGQLGLGANDSPRKFPARVVQ